MPPPTSPTSPRSPVQHRPLTPLAYLSSPVQDLVSTFSTDTADQADEDNVSFLRSSLEELEQATQTSRTRTEAHRDPRRPLHPQLEAYSQPSAAQSSRRETAEDLSRRERLQRVLTRLNRLHEPPSTSATAYSNHTPSPTRQSLYDWAPSYNDNDPQDNELDAILNELRRQQPDTHPDILRVLSPSQLDGSRGSAQQGEGSNSGAAALTTVDSAERRDRLRDRRRREVEWAGLRTRAAMQRTQRPEGSGSPSATARSQQQEARITTQRMLRYVMERERSGMSEEEERARGSGWFRPSPSRAVNEEQRNDARDWTLSPPSADAREAFRREYLAENVPSRLPHVSTPPALAAVTPTRAEPSFLESALQYLSDLRYIPSSVGMDEEESRRRESQVLSVSMDHGLATKELWADKHDDFIMDLETLEPIADSSWMQPGTVFDGHQHATNPMCSLAHIARPRAATVTHVLEQINPNYSTSRHAEARTAGFDHPPGSTSLATPPFDASRPWLSHIPPQPPPHLSSSRLKTSPQDLHHDRWPVRVIIHSIDARKMTLQGTMEAYDVPQPSLASLTNTAAERPTAGKRDSPIVTYLEGHIIDLTTHNFLTPQPVDKKSNSKAVADGPPARSPGVEGDIIFPSASASSDAANWRRLPPFSSLPSEDDMARLLLSTAQMNEINEQYIFMRWKERCFVHSSKDSPPCSDADRHGDRDRGHGLTISGFYYVSLRRSDGVCEGLYWDPRSAPWQHLGLRGVGGRAPAMQFS